MLSRRSVRVKVVQIFYAMSRDETLYLPEARRIYTSSVQSSYDLFLYNLYSLVEITKIATDDAEKRKVKHLPTEQDKTFVPKLFENEIIQSLVDNKALNKLYDQLNFRGKSDTDFFRKIYGEFAKEEAYQAYLVKESTKEDHLEILLELFRLCRRSEYYNEVMEEKYLNWIDDKSLVVGAIKKSIKAQPEAENKFYEAFFPDSQTVKDFGEELLVEGFEASDEILEYIKPALDNWDHERVAIMDMIILKLGVTEFLKFATIPTKVSLNEYVDIAKMYSTAKSKEFVNGVLDNLMKSLLESGKIEKEGRGLID